MRITMEPALNFQWFLTESARSAIRNGGAWKDAPLLEIGYIVNHVIDEHEVPKLPPTAKRLLFGIIARVAILLKKTGHVQPLAVSSKVVDGHA